MAQLRSFAAKIQFSAEESKICWIRILKNWMLSCQSRSVTGGKFRIISLSTESTFRCDLLNSSDKFLTELHAPAAAAADQFCTGPALLRPCLSLTLSRRWPWLTKSCPNERLPVPYLEPQEAQDKGKSCLLPSSSAFHQAIGLWYAD